MSGQFPIDIIGAAQGAEKRHGVFASVSLAQWALESAWGTRNMGAANNCFGLKPWKAGQATTLVSTHEVIRGISTPVMAKFCAFPSIAACFDAHGQFLRDNRRYAKAFIASDGVEQAERIAAAGYATDPNYADKLTHIIEAHGLMRYDATPTIPLPREPAPTPTKNPAPKIGAVVAATGAAAGATIAASGGTDGGLWVGFAAVLLVALVLFLVLHFNKKA